MPVLHVKTLGDNQKAPLVIAHGLFGMLDNWMTLAKRYAENYYVVLLDMRNHGRSFHSDEHSYTAMALDIHDTLRSLKLEKVHLLGHSMGGKAAMQFAIAYPSELYSLTVADISPKEYPPHHDKIVAGLHAVQNTKPTSRKQADSVLSEHLQEFGVRAFLLKNLYRNEHDEYQFRFNLLSLSKNILEIGKEQIFRKPCNTPCLILRGENSDYIVHSEEIQLRNIFQNLHFTTIPSAGHWLHAEQPDLFYNATTLFLSNYTTS